MSVRSKIAVVYHSRGGRTRVLAEAVAQGAASVEGVEVQVLPVEEAEARLGELASADAIVFGCPTFMGSASAPFKAFMDATFEVWAAQGFRDKLAAGFTNSSAPSGDKLGTLTQLAVFAAQHGMIWVGLGLPPIPGGTGESPHALNRLGSHLGAMAQSPIGLGPDVSPPLADRRTAEALGRRVAEAARRWAAGAEALSIARTKPAAPSALEVHPTARSWKLPPPRPPLGGGLRRANLRELAARPGRFEHHLLVVARVGSAQLELAAASEPLYFAHANVSDEYALALPTGDPFLDGFPLRTFLADPETGSDVGRLLCRVGDVVLHPHGLLHWPGRLRPPFSPFEFPPGMRRTGLSLVFCAASPISPGPRPLFVSAGREADAKAYAADPLPFLLCEARAEAARAVGDVGGTRLDLLVRPARIAPPRGGYVVVLEADASRGHFATDLVFVPEGEALDAEGIERALLFSSDAEAPAPPPETWARVPDPPFPPFEESAPGSLPVSHRGLLVEESTSGAVRVTLSGASVDVPRYWLARMLFRLALHGFRMGYVETYGGLFFDDRGGRLRLGLRGAGALDLDDRELPPLVERLYRAVAPPGYVERLA